MNSKLLCCEKKIPSVLVVFTWMIWTPTTCGSIGVQFLKPQVYANKLQTIAVSKTSISYAIGQNPALVRVMKIVTFQITALREAVVNI